MVVQKDGDEKGGKWEGEAGIKGEGQTFALVTDLLASRRFS